jgi:ABC-type transport system involved in cytochrome c biogenesis permease subunit
MRKHKLFCIASIAFSVLALLFMFLGIHMFDNGELTSVDEVFVMPVLMGIMSLACMVAARIVQGPEDHEEYLA